MLCIDPGAMVIGTVAFVGFGVGCHGGSWGFQCPVLNLLSLLGRGTGSRRSSVGLFHVLS